MTATSLSQMTGEKIKEETAEITTTTTSIDIKRLKSKSQTRPVIKGGKRKAPQKSTTIAKLIPTLKRRNANTTKMGILAKRKKSVEKDKSMEEISTASKAVKRLRLSVDSEVGAEGMIFFISIREIFSFYQNSKN